MSILTQIKSFIIPCVQAIAAIINAEVTVVDDDLKRIYGSGIYSTVDKLAEDADRHDSFFSGILQTGEPGMVTDVRRDANCQNCKLREICTTKAVIGYPIRYRERTLGVIGISAFTDAQCSYVIENYRQLMEFVKYISLLIESQLQNIEYMDQLKLQMSDMNRERSRADLIGSSPKMAELFSMADRVAKSGSTILITGENGSGKGELAKYIHAQSNRSGGPLVSINCGAIPEQLVESELFGYEGGSFTGAKKTGSVGKFELANKGTIFLDEIGELPLSMQVKLLHVLQERTIERIGGKKPISIDIRVIAATNQDLKRMVAEHTFRQDLYYRLNVIPMEMPPLRERGGDIVMLARHFLNLYNQKLHKNLRGFTRPAEDILRTYPWPGNVRELRNIIEYLVNISDAVMIDVQDLPPHLTLGDGPLAKPGLTLNEMVKSYEKSVLETRLKDISGREERLQAARELGISQATLYRKIAEYQL